MGFRGSGVSLEGFNFEVHCKGYYKGSMGLYSVLIMMQLIMALRVYTGF